VLYTVETVDLDAKVSFLRRSNAYPDQPHRVETLETHMSWVFLTDHFAYKLKKPVRYAYLDFRTLEARRQDCLEEVRLNRRLAEQVYLGVVPITEDDSGQLHLEGAGRTTDWLVHMRRLPEERMLDHLLTAGKAKPEDIHRVGQRLAYFYRDETPIETNPREYLIGFEDDLNENLGELTDPFFRLPTARIECICHRQRCFLTNHPASLHERVNQGWLIEGHGDLRPQHVCLMEEPVVIDCLEFKRSFRILDAADELAYLALECERLGAPWAGDQLFVPYCAITGDRPLPAVVSFYKSFRAVLRAKIAIWHNREQSVSRPQKWIQRALHYLDLAERHANRFEMEIQGG
jgi:aminoglycoside phosphotransferase family enzyme